MASRWRLTIVALCTLVVIPSAHGDIYRWDTGEVIPGTEGIEPGPGIRLVHYCREDRNLYFADLSGGLDLTGADFRYSCMDNARLDDANLTNAGLAGTSLKDADLSGTNLTGVYFDMTTLVGADLTGSVMDRTRYYRPDGFTKEQLYSTTSYQQQDLRELWFHVVDLKGWDFSGQNLTGTHLCASDLADASFANADLTNARFSDFECSPHDLTNADFTGAAIAGALLNRATRAGFTKEQLYSTASWQQKNLRGIWLAGNDFVGVDFSEQDLSAANLRATTLNDADLNGAILANADLSGSSLSHANLTDANLKNTRLHASDLQTVRFDAATVYNQWTLFPEGFDPMAAGLAYQSSPVGDFDPNDSFDASDIDMLTARIADSGYWLTPDALFDLNSDSVVDLTDHRVWIKELKRTWFGDANMDGEFNSEDMVQVFASAKYETGWVEWSEGRHIIHSGAGWSEGDWNGDGFFTSSDMVTAFADGGYEKGPRPPAVAVPEPTAAILLLGSLIAIATHRRRYGP